MSTPAEQIAWCRGYIAGRYGPRNVDLMKPPAPPPPQVDEEAITYIEGESKRHRRKRLERAKQEPVGG